MARTFDGPLTADDLVYLRQRHSTAYVDRQVALLGTADSADTEDEIAAAEEAAAKARAEAEAAANESADEAQRKADEEAAEAARAAEEDLIGDSGSDGADGSFDVLGATETEVKEWASSASDADKAAALSVEQARDDRDPRKGVVSLLS